MAGVDGDAFLIQGGAYVFGAEAVENKGEDAGFLARRSNEVEAGDALHRLGGIEQKLVLVTGDIHHADAFEVVDCRAESNGITDAAGAGFESARRGLIVRRR